MKWNRRFQVSASFPETVVRIHQVLDSLGYRQIDASHALIFERGAPGAALVAVNPFAVFTRFTITLDAVQSSGVVVNAELDIQKFGQPYCRMDKDMWEGEFDDLQNWTSSLQAPTVDRRRQGSIAGAYTAIWLIASFIGLAVTAIGLGGRGMAPIGMGLLVLIAILALYLLLPIRAPKPPLETRLIPPFPP